MGIPDTPEHPAPAEPAAWIRAVAAGLTSAGLSPVLHETRAGLDLTATVHQPGRREAEVILDEDGYAELHWWTDPGAAPADMATGISRLLTTVTAASAAPAPEGARS